MVQSRTGRDRLCQTGEVTDTRHWEPRPGAGPSAPTAVEIAAATGERPACPSWRSIAGAAIVSSQATGRGGHAATSPLWCSVREFTVDSGGEGSGGWTAGAGARMDPRRAGKEVR
jgi:hypothetical protein